MTNSELISILNETNRDNLVDLFERNFTEEPSKYDSDETVEFKENLKTKSISVELVDEHGGEDEGAYFWSVYSFSTDEGDVLIKFEGSYYSYEGSTYERFYEVERVEKFVTVYENKT